MGEIRAERSEGLVRVTISSPETKNAMTAEMFDDFKDLCEEVDSSSTDRVMIVTGAPGAFCSGADLKAAGGDMAAGFADRLGRMKRIHAGALALYNCSKPTIASVNGIAAGAGANLALGCDLVLAAQSARFTQIFVKRGLVVDYGGSYLLPRLIGIHRAMELALTGDMIDAPEAERIGLINRVFPDEDLASGAETVAQKILSAPPVQTALIKQNMKAGAASSMEEALGAEAQAQATAMGTEDLLEAMAAWVQKREPEFKGR